jgi:hypothetical protein
LVNMSDSKSSFNGDPWKVVHNKIRFFPITRFSFRHEKLMESLWCQGTCFGYLSPSMNTDGCVWGEMALQPVLDLKNIGSLAFRLIL